MLIKRFAGRVSPAFPVEQSVKSALLSIAAVLLSVGSSYGYPQRAPDDFGHSRANVTPNKAVIMGKASWYGQAAAGQRTATGERLDPDKLTAACTQLPLQSRAVVTNLENGRSVGVRINDCGPYTKGRQIDVSKRAAERLDMADRGTAPVKIESIAPPLRPVYCRNPKSRRQKANSRRSSRR
jgi:rare lipoprotein A